MATPILVSVSFARTGRWPYLHREGILDFKTDPWSNMFSEAKDCVRAMLQQVG